MGTVIVIGIGAIVSIISCLMLAKVNFMPGLHKRPLTDRYADVFEKVGINGNSNVYDAIEKLCLYIRNKEKEDS